jgi:hypothetical protein
VAFRCRARIADLIEASDGGPRAFDLQTRHAALHRPSSAAPRALSSRAGSGAESALLEKFRQTRARAVATMAFGRGRRTGQSSPPSSSTRSRSAPSDPWCCALRGHRGARQKLFAHYHVPSAAITLKQGFAAHSIAQRRGHPPTVRQTRVHTKGYGHTYSSLPPARRTEDLDEQSFRPRLARDRSKSRFFAERRPCATARASTRRHGTFGRRGHEARECRPDNGATERVLFGVFAPQRLALRSPSSTVSSLPRAPPLLSKACAHAGTSSLTIAPGGDASTWMATRPSIRGRFTNHLVLYSNHT